MTAAVLITGAIAAAFRAGRFWEARSRARAPGWAEPHTARDLERMLGSESIR